MQPRHTSSLQAGTLPAAVVLCLAVLMSAACGGRADPAAAPISTPAPTLGATVAAPGNEAAGAASAESTRRMMGGTADGRRWERVLDRLDRLRSRAFESLSPGLLRKVYLSGSAVLRHERAVLEGYRDRGVRLLGVRLLRTQLRVVSVVRGQVTVRVVERLGTTKVVVGSRRVRLPVDAPTSRVLHLVRGETGWRIAAAHRVRG